MSNKTSEIVERLSNRLKTNWTDDNLAVKLFKQYWENLIEFGDGLLSGDKELTEAEVAEIVADDYVNNCTVIRKGDKYWDACMTAVDYGVSEVCDNDPDDSDSEDNIIYRLESSADDENGELAFLVVDY